MTMSMRRALCAVMVFAVVEKSGTVVLSDGEKLDSWSVILNGHVEVSKQDGTIQHLHMGDRQVEYIEELINLHIKFCTIIYIIHCICGNGDFTEMVSC